MSSHKYFINKNGKCKYNFPIQIPIITPPKGQIVFGNNVMGPDGWPASRPNQSNLPFTNGISGLKIANGDSPYVYSLTKVNFVDNHIIVPNISTYQLVNNDNNNPFVRSYYTGNKVILNNSPIKYMILARDLKINDDVIGFGKVISVEKVLTNRLNKCCLCNTPCVKKI